MIEVVCRLFSQMFRISWFLLPVEHWSLIFFLILFIYFWLCWVFIVAWGLSLDVVSGSYSLVVLRLLVEVASLAGRAHALGHAGFIMSVGSVVWHTGPVALWHVQSSQTRCQTHVPCIDRWTPNLWTSREVQSHYRFAIEYFCVCCVLALCFSPMIFTKIYWY